MTPGLRLVAGMGCTTTATAEDILGLLQTCLRAVESSPEAVIALATGHTRRDHAGLRAAARALGVPLRVLDSATLAAVAPHLPTPSHAVLALTGLPGLAEAVALAAGPLIVPKTIGRGVTCALAQVPADFSPEGFGDPA